jgi:predicted phosphodiesterase
MAHWQPDEVIIIGDFMDYPQPSTWSKATAEEFKGSVFADSEIGKRVLGDMRVGYLGLCKLVRGNHDIRPELYLRRYAPALAESNAFAIETLLDLNSFGIELAPDFYEFAPGWVATHGHLGIQLSNIPGRTALGAAKKIGKSVVMGHTHRLAKMPDTIGRNGEFNTLWGMEVGHVMDMRPGSVPHYLKGGFANWQSGFGIAYVDGNNVYPQTVSIDDDGRFVFEGEVFDAYGRGALV